MQPPAKQLLWNDREARSVIPVAACDSKRRTDAGGRMSSDLGFPRAPPRLEPGTRGLSGAGHEICRIVDTGRR